MAEDDHADLGKCGTRMEEEKGGRHFRSGRTKNSPDLQFHVGRQLLGHVSFEGSLGTNVQESNSGSREMGCRTG